MSNELENTASAYSAALGSEGVVYFNFEADFIEDNVRCIPMIARFKLDACGIKLSLKQWSKMHVDERNFVAEAACETVGLIAGYKTKLETIILNRTNEIAKQLEVAKKPEWAKIDNIPSVVEEQCRQIGIQLTTQQWQHLQVLQRFALVKLSNASHEHKNLPRALKEFGLM
jgi:hypothetical protein